MTVPPRVVDMVPIARYVQQLETVYGPRGPEAVVAARGGSVEVLRAPEQADRLRLPDLR
jgi:hypothetical protein